MSQITLSTKVTGRTATFIANILINRNKNKYTSCNITTPVSDHLPLFLIIKNFKGKTCKIKNPKEIIQDHNNLNSKSFKSNIKRDLLVTCN